MTETLPDRWTQRAAGAPHNYDLTPELPLAHGERIRGAAELWTELAELALSRAGDRAPVIAIDAYPGVELGELAASLAAALPDWTVVDAERAALPIAAIDEMLAPQLTNDRVFGRMTHFVLNEFYDPAKLDRLAADLAAASAPTIVIGWGAALAAPAADVLVLADLARWEIQARQRNGQPNWRCENFDEDRLRKYKRSFFVEWRVADRHKRELFDRIDFVLDTNRGVAAATAITGGAFRSTLRQAVTRPFRVVPYFDPGVWGGNWMQTMLDLEPTDRNYAWCFDCVPEENSLLVSDGSGRVVELPAMDLVLREPRGLLGAKTFARFGAEFPIRFDFLDTMDGGNLSLQVHPLTDYMQQVFGMPYTQDESYYMLDAEPGAVVYLGLKKGIEPQRMLEALEAAQRGDEPFPAEEYVNVFPANKHDHFAIPAGTVHCSGADSMVLEISATPYIFTFKLWDWGRVGIDGVPRPIHLEHGANNIQWDRDSTWVEQNLIDQVVTLGDEPGHREERTGLHELEYIEVRRHWFDRRISLHTRGTVNVLNLVEGDAVAIVSPAGAFEPFEVHYAETFIVPAAVGAYDIMPVAGSTRSEFGVVVATVRGTETQAVS